MPASQASEPVSRLMTRFKTCACFESIASSSAVVSSFFMPFTVRTSSLSSSRVMYPRALLWVAFVIRALWHVQSAYNQESYARPARDNARF